MDAFKNHTGVIAPLDTANVDTDQIIAKQFLKSIKRTGFGEHLFHDWRFKADGKEDSSFSLNDPDFAKASILVTRNNFGCGSSREHAVWAIQQYGFKVILAPWKDQNDGRIPGFADIFRNNSFKNGLLTIELSEEEVDRVFQAVSEEKGVQATVDLEKQSIKVLSKVPFELTFVFDATTKERFLKGLDDIGLTLAKEASISEFEKKHNFQIPSINVS